MCDSKACYCKQNLPSAGASGGNSFFDMMRRQSLAKKPSIRKDGETFDSLYDMSEVSYVKE